MSGRRRCAIYTRKSTEEGLDMAFNSLDAQREACEAYVHSQRSEGWKLLPEAYDDGGYSGGSMDRPALKRLLADVEAGLVDIIVVYKVDRLTRALSDFARIVDVLDARGASFVSITQAFNTTSSMGRLTLNVLLSFAQFEREVIAERVRDKIAQSKARGLWMGGPVPLGYEVRDRKLIPHREEAATVRHIFELYLQVPSVRALKERLDKDGIVTKIQKRKKGHSGGVPFGRGGLYHLLSNPIVIGKIRHKGKIHDGEHPAIIPLPLWHAVQDRLAAHGVERLGHASQRGAKLLTGMIRDHVGRPMSPSFCSKSGRRYHYYASGQAGTVTQASDPGDVPAMRIAQKHADQAVTHAVLQLFSRSAVLNLLEPLDLDLPRTQAALDVAQEIEQRTGKQGGLSLRSLLLKLRFSMVMAPDSLTASIDRQRLLALLLSRAPVDDGPADPMPMAIPLEVRRIGNAARMVLKADIRPLPDPDPKLVRLLVNAERSRQAMFAPGGARPTAHQVRLARLAYLAPDITTAILEGRQPPRLTSRSLLKLPDLPMDWAAQRKVLGFRKIPD